MRFDRHVAARLDDLARAGILRTPRLLDGRQGTAALIDGREVLVFCSNDYLGHGDHPALRAALADGAARWGASASASRLVSGTKRPHRDAESALASLVGAPSAVLFSTGYAANVGALQALVGPGDLILSDALNHASLIDGCRLSRAEVRVFPHRDLDAAAVLLAQHRRNARACLIVTDSIFSMDGDAADLVSLRALADRHDAGLLVDEAHALGIAGPAGAGLCAERGVRPDVLIGTLGKAFGLSGAFAAGSPQIAQLIENRARSYVFSTAPAPAIAAATPVAVALVRGADEARERLRLHTRTLRDALRRLGHAAIDTPSPILPILLGDPAPAMRASAALLERGIFVHGIRPPTVPEGTARLRLVPMATHSDDDVARCIDALEHVFRGGVV